MLEAVKVTFENGNVIYSGFNPEVGREDIAKYYMGNYFDVGIYPKEDFQKVVKVEFDLDSKWQGVIQEP